MKEKELIVKLNKLKAIKPSSKWQETNRELLKSQIEASGSIGVNSWSHRIKLPFMMVRQMSQPVMAAFLIFGFLFAGSFVSLRAASDTVPGDSLYVAKMISEKTQQAFTFDEKKKIKLGLSFASKRAEELDIVLADVEHEEEKDEKIEQLVNNFKKEIDAAKTRINRIKEETIAVNTETPEQIPDIDEEKEEDPMVFSANASKDEEGISISEIGTEEESTDIEESEETTETEEVIEAENIDEITATPTSETAEITASTSEEQVAEEEPAGAQTILGEAEELLEKDAYEEIIDKLDKAGEALDLTIESGQIQGQSEQATSTTDVGEVLGEEASAGDTASTTE